MVPGGRSNHWHAAGCRRCCVAGERRDTDGTGTQSIKGSNMSEPSVREAEIESVPVHITKPVSIIAEEREPEDFSVGTIIIGPLAAGEGPRQILALDPLRKDALIISNDQPIVLCHTAAQA